MSFGAPINLVADGGPLKRQPRPSAHVPLIALGGRLASLAVALSVNDVTLGYAPPNPKSRQQKSSNDDAAQNEIYRRDR